ncbi:hypothetical protein RhiJN_23392 [Ceratobasidium sp. AG-Ba]|nr:hypothetical protein RhiJN_23392 [Ceratobasidium sp. AG-Ba]
MFNKFVITTTTLVAASSLLMGAVALPTNVSEVTARSINPAGTHTGQLTYYEVGLGACGHTNQNFEYVAAIPYELFDNWPGYTVGNPINHPACSRTAEINYMGKTIRVGIVDRCASCALWDLALSPGAYQAFAQLSVGHLSNATWRIL